MDSSYLYDYKPAMATTNLLTKAIIDAPIPSVVYPKNENLMENVNYLNTPKTATGELIDFVFVSLSFFFFFFSNAHRQHFNDVVSST